MIIIGQKSSRMPVKDYKSKKAKVLINIENSI